MPFSRCSRWIKSSTLLCLSVSMQARSFKVQDHASSN